MPALVGGVQNIIYPSDSGAKGLKMHLSQSKTCKNAIMSAIEIPCN
jgi:hypothetical protein